MNRRLIPIRPALAWAAALLSAAMLLSGTVRLSEASRTTTPPPNRGELILYCSADSVYAKTVLEAFERSSGVTVKPVFDTEATKTFGLVQRLINEKETPQADVFFSSEAMGMIRLARAGVLDPYTSQPAERAFAQAGGWPSMLRASDRTWYGFARRMRVLVYNTRQIKPEDLPRRLADLSDPRFKGRIGIARPEFGTTRGHLGALRMSAGEVAFKAWCQGLKVNEIREFDGNMSVVRAVGRAEIHIGFTDTDDVYAGLANEWPIAAVMVSEQLLALTHDRTSASLLAYPEHPMQSPHTIAIVKGAKNRANAERFVDFLLSEQADLLLSKGDARTFRTYMPPPTSPASRGTNSDSIAPTDPKHQSPSAAHKALPATDNLRFMVLNLEQAADYVEEALALWTQAVR